MQPKLQNSDIHIVMQRVLFVLVGLIAASISFLVLERFTRAYKIDVVRRTVAINQAQPSASVINSGRTKLQVLAINYHADPQQRFVVLRDLRGNQLLTLRIGASTPQGVAINAIEPKTVTLSYKMQLIILTVGAKISLNT